MRLFIQEYESQLRRVYRSEKPGIVREIREKSKIYEKVWKGLSIQYQENWGLAKFQDFLTWCSSQLSDQNELLKSSFVHTNHEEIRSEEFIFQQFNSCFFKWRIVNGTVADSKSPNLLFWTKMVQSLIFAAGARQEGRGSILDQSHFSTNSVVKKALMDLDFLQVPFDIWI